MMRTISMMVYWLMVVSIFTLVEGCENLLENDPDTACSFPNTVVVTNGKGEVVDSRNCGSIKVNKNDWQNEPTVIFSAANESASYTMLLIDPDVPNYPKGQYYLHWLVTNIPGNGFRNGDISKGNKPDPFVGPGPPANSGDHRYMFIVLEEFIYNQKLSTPNGRSNFELLKWLNSQDEELCGPVGGAEFKAAYE